MDSRDIHQQQQLPPGMLMGHNNSFNRNSNAATLMGPTSTSQAMHHRLPFGTISTHQPQHQQQHPHHHHPQPQQHMDQKTLESLGFDGSPSSVASHQHSIRFGIEQQPHQQAKKKRGRPRKYAPDGNIALGLAPTSPLPSASNSYGGGTDGGGGDSSGANANSSDPPAKRNRGRPPGSGKKQLDALGGTGGVGFTPHVIEVKTGEDIALKVMAFTNQGPRAICILSATGAVSGVMLHQGATSNGVAKYEGQYQIICLSGSFLNTESNGTVTKSGNLRVSLASPEGVVIGGSVAGMLVAGSEVQVIVGTFVVDGKKPKQSAGGGQSTPEPASALTNMLSFGGGPGSPRSQGQQHSSESSEENESNSPVHSGNNHHGLFGNSMPQPMHQMPTQMYQHLWPSSK